MKSKSALLIAIAAVTLTVSACGNKVEDDSTVVIKAGDKTTASSHQNTSSLIGKEGTEKNDDTKKDSNGSNDESSETNEQTNDNTSTGNKSVEDATPSELKEKTILGTWSGSNGEVYSFTKYEVIIEADNSETGNETTNEQETREEIRFSGYANGYTLYGTATTDNSTYIELTSYKVNYEEQYEDVEKQVVLEDGTIETQIVQQLKQQEPEVIKYTISKFDWEASEGDTQSGNMIMELKPSEGESISLKRVAVDNEIHYDTEIVDTVVVENPTETTEVDSTNVVTDGYTDIPGAGAGEVMQ